MVREKENYKDNRWMTFLQVKEKGYKLKNAKDKGVPIEFWSVYDIKSKKKISFEDYNKIISNNEELKDNYKVFSNTSFVYNGDLIEGLPKLEIKFKNINISKYVKNIIKVLGVKYSEKGDKAYYVPKTDEIVLPNKNLFFDEKNYYATLLHEVCHSTGHEKRLNRDLNNIDKSKYAREELIAEISSSFLMTEMDIELKNEDYNNHKNYIKEWISILTDKPNELFDAIKEATKVADYVNEKIKEKEKNKER